MQNCSQQFSSLSTESSYRWSQGYFATYPSRQESSTSLSRQANALGCPYIIVSFISGSPLYDVWFGHRLNGASHEAVRERRTRALENIASAMVQLDKFSFPARGPLLFGSDGSPSGTESMREILEPDDIDPFILAHSDPDIQNSIVSENGELQGIIDWDGVAAVPRPVGNRSYPRWPTRDWD
ncbi:hypothetical protein B0T14DRAFT_570586 [Immersiella caudata]|uniref:Aminoglycoside phosphotransferase domain-containing protein n=1 Tax=Immersiella caudata TaxID=314043 RepID=A0AA40BV18_9PEZI|nr:hypothetical protein B0T14DRAFT_570586 [Immersiella caudata]